MTTQEPSFDINKFYSEKDPPITDQTKAILTANGIPLENIITHIRNVRDKGWQQVKFPCIGHYAFLEFSIGRCMNYDELLQRLQCGATLLDIGCCFGQDIRKLVLDGAPAANLTGAELEQVFLDLGYELFNDKKALASKFVCGDIFAEGAYGLQDGSFDFVHAGSFFHQFSWEEQIESLTKCLRLLKPQPGSMLLGRQIATVEPGVVKHPALRSGEAYHHSIDTWERLVAEIAENVGLEMDVVVDISEVKRDGNWKMMRFCISRK